MSTVLIVDYDPLWPQRFETLRSGIWPAVADLALSVEHVGSTSVPGLAAKPVIDMDVVVPRAKLRDAIARLATLGYAHRGDLGIPDREAFARPAGSPPHHLYLCPPDSPAHANHMAVRDHLRANPSVAGDYGRLKQRLAREFPDDIDGYIEGKTAFLVDILRARAFPEDALEVIERRNARPPVQREGGQDSGATHD